MSVILITGRNSKVKTGLVKSIAEQFKERNADIQFFDCGNEFPSLYEMFKSQFISFKTSQFPFSIVEPPNLEEKGYYWNLMVSETIKVRGMRIDTSNNLTAVLSGIDKGLKDGEYYPSLSQFAEILTELGRRKKSAVYETASRLIRSLCAVLGRSAYVTRSVNVRKHFSVICWVLKDLPPRDKMSLCGLIVIRHLFQSSGKATGRTKHVLIFLDSTPFFDNPVNTDISTQVSAFRRLVQTCDSINTTIVISVTNLATLDPVVLSSSKEFVCFKARNREEAYITSNLLGLGKDGIERIMELPDNVAYAYQEGWERAILINVETPDDKIPMTEEEMEFHLEDKRQMIESLIKYSPKSVQDVEPINYNDMFKRKEDKKSPVAPIISDEILFLTKVEDNKDKPIAEIFEILGWSRTKGDNLKNRLEHNGYIKIESVKVGKGRPKQFCSITERGRKLFLE